MSTWSPKRITPRQLRILVMWFNGHDQLEIANELGIVPQTVSITVNSDWAQAILQQMKERTFDTLFDVQATAQGIAPAAMEETIRLALNGTEERTRTVNCKTILDIAGHRPVTRVDLSTHSDRLDKYDGMTEDQLRAEVMRQVTNPTVH